MGRLGAALQGAGAGAAAGSAAGPWGTAIGGVAGGIIGLISGDGAKEQLEQQKKLNESAARTNYLLNEKAAENAFGRTNTMYDKMFADNTPEAQLRRLKEAGLSPGLMYGGAGSTGGANVGAMAQGAGSSGAASAGHAANEAERANSRVAQMGMALQLAKVKSEIDVNEATAEGIKTDAEKKRGVDTELGNATIKQITEQTKNITIQRQGAILQNEFDSIRNNIAGATTEAQIKTIEAAYEKLEEELTEAVRNNEIGEDMKETTKATMKQNLRNMMVEEIQKLTSTKLTARQTEEIGQLIELKALEGKTNIVALQQDLIKFGINLGQHQNDQFQKLMEATMGLLGKIGIAGAIK